MKVFKAPEDFYDLDHAEQTHIFLGGSIEMGKAEKWQDWLTKRLSQYKDIVVLNPRRDDWDSTWEQDPTHGTKFYEQVTWEMEAQECSDIAVYYFAANTMSPITLLELGAYGEDADTIVYVDPAYERRGNVIMYCERYDISWVEDKEKLVWELEQRILGI